MAGHYLATMNETAAGEPPPESADVIEMPIRMVNVLKPIGGAWFDCPGLGVNFSAVNITVSSLIVEALVARGFLRTEDRSAAIGEAIKRALDDRLKYSIVAAVNEGLKRRGISETYGLQGRASMKRALRSWRHPLQRFRAITTYDYP